MRGGKFNVSFSYRVGRVSIGWDECGWQADRLGPAMIAILVEYRNLEMLFLKFKHMCFREKNRNLDALRAWYPFLTVSTSLWNQFKEKRQGGILYPGSIERTLAYCH